ncbi:MAG TPA: septum formation initiator family protein [Longimicrobium sp.]|nr:septum formation initiator family protein [Longimicrobium sp.]
MALRPRGRHLVAGAALALALYYAVWGGEYSVFTLLRLKNERQAARGDLARLHHEVDSLRAEARKLDGDPATIERVARERFGMIREGETLYRFVPIDSAAAKPGSPR